MDDNIATRSGAEDLADAGDITSGMGISSDGTDLLNVSR